MFCPNCGNRNPDNANVCGNCGTRLSRPVVPTQNMQQPMQRPVQRPVSQPIQPPVYQPVQNMNYQQMPQGQFMTNNLPQTATKKSNNGVIIAVISMVLAIAIGFSAFFIIDNKKDKESKTETGANTPEDVAEKYVKAYFEYDADIIFETVHEKYIEVRAREKRLMEKHLSVSEFKKYFISCYKAAKEHAEEKYGKYTVTTKVVSCEKIDEKDFYRYRGNMKYYYDLEISDVRRVEVEWTINGEKKNDSGKRTFLVFKVGSKWYVDDLAKF